MLKSFEEGGSKLIYPTQGDLDNLRRIVEINANGANIHDLSVSFANLQNMFEEAKDEGWTSARFEAYNKEKIDLNMLLLGKPKPHHP